MTKGLGCDGASADIAVGDVMEAEIPCIGVLRNAVEGE